jgi:acetate kinase
LPDCPQVAVFDTAFHQTMPREAYLYGLPLEYHSEHRIRRYGFHGTSHRWACLRHAELNGSSPTESSLITCHLGSGSSLCAIDRGRSVDVSLGFTPLEGLVMGTRSGDLDPGLMLHLMEKHGLSVTAMTELLTKRSGLLGLSGGTNDMRVLVEKSKNGDERAQIAIDVFCYRVRRYIGSFFGILNGADALIFTGGIGENSAEIRRRCCESLDALGIRLNERANVDATGKEMMISADGAHPSIWVIPSNEELLIARETVRCVGNRR